jgi:hypothetical protein
VEHICFKNKKPIFIGSFYVAGAGDATSPPTMLNCVKKALLPGFTIRIYSNLLPFSTKTLLNRVKRNSNVASMKILFTTFLILSSSITSGQSLKKIEQDLLLPLSRIATVVNGAYYDSLYKDNENFEKMLKKYLTSVQSTMTYPFSKLIKEGLSIATSNDKKLRIYSWDKHTGGTMHYFANIYQYKVSNKVYSNSPIEIEQEGGDPRGFFSEIIIVDSVSHIYLGLRTAIYSTKDCGNIVKAFKIENNGLNDSLLLFKVDTAMVNEFGIGFDFFSVVNRPERPVKLIYYDEKTKTLKLPVIGDKDEVTDKFIFYRYNERYFEEVKN